MAAAQGRIVASLPSPQRIYAPKVKSLAGAHIFYGHREEVLSAGLDQGCDATLKKVPIDAPPNGGGSRHTPQELLPGMPLIEITGAGRVLIENHGGVTEYETDRIGFAYALGRW